ncbi:flavodoxin domain-containing protein [Bacillus sp. X1(2014)]|uniref:flavodoxin domain-containing protein n=1 Tax=Bacillus sp. X1(2014) TaxID=1565991 RepID=UPI00119F2B0A|nr:flavodoxin domain-containing protein [Bacillus sp. X1(2014)]
MNVAIVYSSKTGNTEEAVHLIQKLFLKEKIDVTLYRIEELQIRDIINYEAVVIGTYTWGNGEIPHEMMELYHAFEKMDVKSILTGIVGTGDSGYPKFCGAVDEFRDMLYVHTTLIVTLKIEVSLQVYDIDRCRKFVSIFRDQLNQKQTIG